MDTSNKEFGDMNYYDRENDKWYDEKLKENFIQISRGKYIKPMDFYIKIHFETVIIPYFGGAFEIKVGDRKPLKIFLNVRLRILLGLLCLFHKEQNFLYVFLILFLPKYNIININILFIINAHT